MSFERWEQFVKETAQQLKKEPKKQRNKASGRPDQQKKEEVQGNDERES